MNELKKRDPLDIIKTTDDLTQVSDLLAASGFFADAKDAAQCAVKVLAGLEMGFGAFASMTGIHIIDGKPSIGANLMAAAVKRSGRYNYRVTELTDDICRIKFFENGQLTGESTFSIQNAKDAGVQFKSKAGYPTPWAKFPRNLLFARALSNGVRWYCPDVFDAPTYTPEELGASVDEEGGIIDVEPRSTEETIGNERASAMHKAMAVKLNLRPVQHYQLATLALGRKIDSFSTLTEEEARAVWAYAEDNTPNAEDVEVSS